MSGDREAKLALARKLLLAVDKKDPDEIVDAVEGLIEECNAEDVGDDEEEGGELSGLLG